MIIGMVCTLALLMGFTTNVTAQSAVGVDAQITQESDLVSGNKYILQSMASGKKVVVK